MTVLIFMLCCFIGGMLGWRLAERAMGGSFIPKALKPKKKIPDYDFIAAMDQEIFGLEANDERPQDTPKEIDGLAGYTTKLRKDYDGDLVCELVSPQDGVVEIGYVYTRDYVHSGSRSKTDLTAEQLEQKVNKKFSVLIEARKNKLAQAASMESLMSKYNNKAVEQ
jgi:hypothetical protein